MASELTLTAQEREHEARVLSCLRERIRCAGGPLPFSAFMQIALYEPGLGYYSAGARKFGEGGDFVTAPEISRLFGRCVARQCAQVLATTGGGILEFGAGSGALAAGILTTLAAQDTLPEHYRILEVSAELRDRQRQRLAQLPPALASRVEWLDALPASITGVVLANEVLDALPTERFAWHRGQPRWSGVALDSRGLPVEAVLEREPPGANRLFRERFESLSLAWPEGYRAELNTLLAPWVASVGERLERGALIAIDYGTARADLYRADRVQGTMRAYFRHRAHDDVYARPGLQDLTAWVDFTAVAEAAVGAGLTVSGYATQAAFLLALGIESDVAAAADDVARYALAGEARRLLMPTEMGETFKAIALTRGFDPPLAGFSLQDLRRLL